MDTVRFVYVYYGREERAFAKVASNCNKSTLSFIILYISEYSAIHFKSIVEEKFLNSKLRKLLH